MRATRTCSRFTSAAAVSLLSALIYLTAADSGYALNGYTYISVCPCVVSTDYINAATLQAQQVVKAGNYTVVSSSGSATAIIQVQGNLNRLGNGRVVLDVYSAVPVNSSGISLAGESESELEAYFASYDQVLVGTSRSNPLQVNEPSYYTTTFINSQDVEVGPGIDQALAAQGVNWNSLSLGTTVTVVFPDGTKAIYIKFQVEYTDHWQWTGVAWDKNGNRINRAGQVQKNPNTSGGGGGSVDAPGFGTGNRWSWAIFGGGSCTQNITINEPDGSSINLGTIVVPC